MRAKQYVSGCLRSIPAPDTKVPFRRVLSVFRGPDSVIWLCYVGLLAKQNIFERGESFDSASMMSSRRGLYGQVGNLHSLVSIRIFYVGHLRIGAIGDGDTEYQLGKDQVSKHRQRNSRLVVRWCVEFECLYATSSGLNVSRTRVAGFPGCT